MSCESFVNTFSALIMMYVSVAEVDEFEDVCTLLVRCHLSSID